MHFITVSLEWSVSFSREILLSRQITDSDYVRLGLVYLNFVFSTANGVMFCEIYLQSVAHITTIHDLFIYFIFKFFLTDPRSRFSSTPRSFSN